MLPKITLMDVYVIESLRKKGVSEQTIIEKVRNHEVEAFHRYEEGFDYTVLYALEEEGILEKVLQEGYEVKFLTYTGLVNLLELLFDKKENIDYQTEDFTVYELKLEGEELEKLKQMVSKNWTVLEENGFVTIKPLYQPPTLPSA